MKNIPNEIIQSILLLLTPRYALQCSLVCKNFYLASRNPILYHTIELYSRGQLEKFIKIATTIKIYEKPIGHWVRHVELVYPFHKYKPTSEDSRLIHATCPYITYIGEDLLFPYMEYLVNYTYHSENNNDKQWVDYIYDHSVSLHILLSPDDDSTLYIETDEHQQRHKKLIGTLNDNVEESINKSNDIEYYGKKIGFTRIFYQLKELCLDFVIFKYDFTYELDERTLEAIHESCPLLETLSLSEFIMNISASYNSSTQLSSLLLPPDKNQHHSTRFIPVSLLKSLKIDHGVLLRNECFDYLNLKYPQLESLDIFLEWDDLLYRDKDHYIKALFSMITDYKHLKKLAINDILFADQFPYNTLIQWLTFNPTQLKKLELYFTDIVFIDEQYKQQQIQHLMKLRLDDDHIMKELHLRRDYLDYLTDININVRSPINTLNYFLRDGNHTTASSSITALKLIGNYRTLDYFYFYDWLDAFPNLKKLSLKSVCVIENENGNGKNNKKSYLLQELGLHQSNIRLKNNITEICQACPLLSSLELEDIGYVDILTPLSSLHHQFLLDDVSFKPIDELNLIDAPQLKLDKLFISNIQYGSFNSNIPIEPSVQHEPLKLTVNEIGLNNTFYIMKKNKAAFFNNIKVNCHSVDVLIFEDNF
ncbi:unnamed protein product [Cunninghamella echinulata]